MLTEFFRRIRFDTPFRRFTSLLWITGIPFFAVRCAIRRHELYAHPTGAIFIAIRDLWETVVLWTINEMIIRLSKRNKE